MEKMRVQKIIAEAGICSRRKAEELIEKGRVKVNGRPALTGQKIDPLKDLVTVDGQRVYYTRKKTHVFQMTVNVSKTTELLYVICAVFLNFRQNHGSHSFLNRVVSYKVRAKYVRRI